MLPLLEEEAHGFRLEPKVRFPQSKPWDEESHTTDGLIASSQKHHQAPEKKPEDMMGVQFQSSPRGHSGVKFP